MNVLHLFSGLDSWGQPSRERGHDVLTLDWDPDFGADLVMDARRFAQAPWRHIHRLRPDWDHVDAVCLGPDCRGFSVAALGHHWHLAPDGYRPKTKTAKVGVELIHASIRILMVLKPRWWVLENPRAILRKLDILDGAPRVTVTYCQYGLPYQKPTDLWGVHPESWRPRPLCTPRSPCHESAPRGSRRGIQGIEGRAVPSASFRHVQISPLDGASWADTVRTKERRQAAAAAVSNHQSSYSKTIRPGAGDPRPLASYARAAALRSVVPRELVLDWVDACEREMRV